MTSQAPPKVSAVLCTYNRHTYLRQAIESILYQTFEDLELIIVDDASSDPQVLEIIRQYEEEYSNVRVIRHTENTGSAGSRNTGIQHARGTYIMMMDDDDISLPQRAKAQYDFLESHPDYAAVTSGYNIINLKGIKVGQQNVLLLIVGAFSMFRRSALLDIGGYRVWFRNHAEDVDLTLRMQEKYKLGSLSLILYEYRDHTGNKLSHDAEHWYHTAAACTSEWHRSKGLRDPVDHTPAPALTDVLSLLESTDISEEVRLMLLEAARGACHATLKSGDYAALQELLRACHRYCVRKTDRHTQARFRKLCFGIFLRVFKYRSFGWLRYHIAACR